MVNHLKFQHEFLKTPGESAILQRVNRLNTTNDIKEEAFITRNAEFAISGETILVSSLIQQCLENWVLEQELTTVTMVDSTTHLPPFGKVLKGNVRKNTPLQLYSDCMFLLYSKLQALSSTALLPTQISSVKRSGVSCSRLFGRRNIWFFRATGHRIWMNGGRFMDTAYHRHW
ncbi:hypothetical protein GQ457_11G007820 [Hibiscus cannabinus]